MHTFKHTHTHNYSPSMCLQIAKGDLDFLKERNMCSACCLCSVLTMDGGAWNTHIRKKTL